MRTNFVGNTGNADVVEDEVDLENPTTKQILILTAATATKNNSTTIIWMGDGKNIDLPFLNNVYFKVPRPLIKLMLSTKRRKKDRTKIPINYMKLHGFRRSSQDIISCSDLFLLSRFYQKAKRESTIFGK